MQWAPLWRVKPWASPPSVFTAPSSAGSCTPSSPCLAFDAFTLPTQASLLGAQACFSLRPQWPWLKSAEDHTQERAQSMEGAGYKGRGVEKDWKSEIRNRSSSRPRLCLPWPTEESPFKILSIAWTGSMACNFFRTRRFYKTDCSFSTFPLFQTHL